MRARTTLAALAVIGLTVLAPSPAHAATVSDEELKHLLEEITGQEEITDEQLEEIQGGLSSEEFHCLLEQVEEVEHLEAVRTCEEAPNPILPATNEIVWAVISFAVLFVLLAKFAFPAIRKGLEGREDAVRGDLETAEQAKAEAEETLNTYRQQLADARNEAARIIDEARQAADGMRREMQVTAEAEAAAARQRAEAEIEQTVSRARSDLQRQVADFAVQLAERIVERNLDRDAQMALVDEYIAEVGGMSGGNGNGGAPSGN